MKFKKQMVVCAHEVSWFHKKRPRRTTFLELWLHLDAIFVEVFFFCKYKTAYFSAFYFKKIFQKNE